MHVVVAIIGTVMLAYGPYANHAAAEDVAQELDRRLNAANAEADDTEYFFSIDVVRLQTP